ncbi:Spo0B domain-containing protein [Paenibacillus sp. TAB 01]|uniref:Spo0B domain-containing protein n=1 Tax=Paenibacillus sp. TAB 01 TaxID=3368988 RepID=UPI003752B8FD
MNSNRSNNEQVNQTAVGMANVPELPVGAWETEQYLRMISLFNHYRHDWMNEIQLLFGYIKLKKYDKLDGLMEKIRVKVQTESLVAKLGVPELVVYLFSFQTEAKNLLLDVHMEQEIHLNELFADAEGIGHMLIAVMELLKSQAVKHPDNEYRMTLRLGAENDALKADFRYEGRLDSRWVDEKVQPLLRQCCVQTRSLINVEDYQTDIEIWVPLNI